MSLKKMLFVVLAVSMTFASVASSAFASEETKSCKADTECGQGEHCKEGHCNKA